MLGSVTLLNNKFVKIHIKLKNIEWCNNNTKVISRVKFVEKKKTLFFGRFHSEVRMKKPIVLCGPLI